MNKNETLIELSDEGIAVWEERLKFYQTARAAADFEVRRIEKRIAAGKYLLTELRRERAMQGLADQAQELGMGY